ncbi:MAG TPA: hypothetical protein VK592_02885 [Candidatus Dormibacteraeota bacterium]|nr:hypothetical protein [Candidatus Dormibacteraeota bacterium]
MLVVVRSLTIAAPAGRVWDRLMHPAERPRRWRGPPGATDAPGWIDQLDPPRHLGLRRSGRLSSRVDVWLEPLPGGSTLVTWREALGSGEHRRDGAGARLAMIPLRLLGPALELVVRSDLRRLRDRIDEG